MSSKDYLNVNGSIKPNIKAKDNNEFEKLIRFANEIGPLQKKYLEEERKIKKPNLDKLVKIFKKNLDRNIKFAKSFNFKTLISINEESDNKKIMIDFRKKKINQLKRSYNRFDPNLIVNIESSKIRNLLFKKYPMNFLTFHNGGYTCERSTMKLTKNEQKYWNWINNLDFFI